MFSSRETPYIYIYIYITRLASKEIFSPSNKIHREVGRTKDLSAPRYKYQTVLRREKKWAANKYVTAHFQQLSIVQSNHHHRQYIIALCFWRPVQLLLRKKAAEELKKEQERKAAERKRIIDERCGKPKIIDDANEGEKIVRVKQNVRLVIMI